MSAEMQFSPWKVSFQSELGALEDQYKFRLNRINESVFQPHFFFEISLIPRIKRSC